jgi:uncharacterized protein
MCKGQIELEERPLVNVQEDTGVTQDASTNSYRQGVDAYERGDYTTAFKILEPLALEGNIEAQTKISRMYKHGHGVPEDLIGGFYWALVASETVYARSQSTLAKMYFDGLGLPQDFEKAAERYEIAANHGSAAAAFDLGEMYREGQGVPQSYRTAVRWYKQAALQENAAAQLMLGHSYLDGRGVQQNYETAIKWLTRSAEQGTSDAQCRLGCMYFEGMGVPEDRVRACMWAIIAVSEASEVDKEVRRLFKDGETPVGQKHIDGTEQALDDAKEALELIELESTHAQIEAGRELAAEWMEEHRN